MGVFWAGAKAAELAALDGADPPHLLTVSRDGALFGWTFEPRTCCSSRRAAVDTAEGAAAPPAAAEAEKEGADEAAEGTAPGPESGGERRRRGQTMQVGCMHSCDSMACCIGLHASMRLMTQSLGSRRSCERGQAWVAGGAESSEGLPWRSGALAAVPEALLQPARRAPQRGRLPRRQRHAGRRLLQRHLRPVPGMHGPSRCIMMTPSLACKRHQAAKLPLICPNERTWLQPWQVHQVPVKHICTRVTVHA